MKEGKYNDMRTDNIERLLRKDAIEKRKTGKGGSHRAPSKKGFKGSVKFPVDFLRGKERRKYMEGETTCRIVTFQEFLNSNKDQRRKMLLNLLETYTRKELAEKWGISCQSLGMYIHKAGGNMPGGRRKKPMTSPIVKLDIESTPTAKFFISLNLRETGGALQNRFSIISATLLPDKQYAVNMMISEMEDDAEKAGT